MQINRDNYEAYFLDYAEGNLSGDQLAHLELFLDANPDLREELEEFQNMSLDFADDASFEDKSALKKSEASVITLDNCEDFFIAYHEGDLSTSEQAVVDAFLAEHPNQQELFDEFGKVELEADASVQFDLKTNLHQIDIAGSITLDNYASFFVAHYEGDLDTNSAALLQQFIAEHPELTSEFESYGKLALEADASIAFEGKHTLQQLEAVGPITLENYTAFFVAHYEGDLDAKGAAGLEHFLAEHPNLTSEFESYSKLALEADASIVFTDKDALLQDEDKGGIIIPLWRNVAVGAAAAAILVFFLVRGLDGGDAEYTPKYSWQPYGQGAGPDTYEDRDSSYTVSPSLNDFQVADNSTTDDQQNQNANSTDSQSDTSSTRPPGGQVQGPIEVIEDPNLNLHIAQDTTTTVDTAQTILNAPQELIANDTSNSGPASAQQNEAVASNTSAPEYLKPRQILGNKLKEKLGIKTSSPNNSQEAVAYGKDGTDERKFSFTKGSTTEYETYQLKVGGISLSRKKRKKPVTK